MPSPHRRDRSETALGLLVPVAVSLDTEVSTTSFTRRLAGAASAHERVEDQLLRLRGLLDEVLHESHRFFQRMPWHRLEVPDVALTCPVEVATSLLREEDHAEVPVIAALPA